MTAIDRRRFLVGAAAAAVPVAAWSLHPWRALVDLGPPPTAAARLGGLLGHEESARALGEAYLQGAPATAGELTRAVAAGLPGGSRTLARAGDDDLRQALAGCMRADFEAERTVLVGGWVVSRTEARLCALSALRAAAEAR